MNTVAVVSGWKSDLVLCGCGLKSWGFSRTVRMMEILLDWIVGYRILEQQASAFVGCFADVLDDGPEVPHVCCGRRLGRREVIGDRSDRMLY